MSKKELYKEFLSKGYVIKDFEKFYRETKTTSLEDLLRNLDEISRETTINLEDMESDYASFLGNLEGVILPLHEDAKQKVRTLLGKLYDKYLISTQIKSNSLKVVKMREEREAAEREIFTLNSNDGMSDVEKTIRYFGIIDALANYDKEIADLSEKLETAKESLADRSSDNETILREFLIDLDAVRSYIAKMDISKEVSDQLTSVLNVIFEKYNGIISEIDDKKQKYEELKQCFGFDKADAISSEKIENAFSDDDDDITKGGGTPEKARDFSDIDLELSSSELNTSDTAETVDNFYFDSETPAFHEPIDFQFPAIEPPRNVTDIVWDFDTKKPREDVEPNEIDRDRLVTYVKLNGTPASGSELNPYELLDVNKEYRVDFSTESDGIKYYTLGGEQYRYEASCFDITRKVKEKREDPYIDMVTIKKKKGFVTRVKDAIESRLFKSWNQKVLERKALDRYSYMQSAKGRHLSLRRN